MSDKNQQWAEEQFEAIEPDQAHVRAFDESDDGARYLEITGMTMWENLGADTLPEHTEE